jgi:hypothetical protein
MTHFYSKNLKMKLVKASSSLVSYIYIYTIKMLNDYYTPNF